MDYLISSDNDGRLALEIIRELGISHSTLKKLKFADDGILLNGERITVRKTVCEGDILSLAVEDKETPEKLCPSSVPLNIIYEDGELVAPSKPPFMPTHQSHGHFTDTLANALAYKYANEGTPFVFRPINRLDRNTSGIVIVAKNVISAAALSESMRRREIKKSYIAILDGTLPEGEGIIDNYIRRAKESVIVREICDGSAEGADRAVTKYKVLASNGGYTLVLAEPLTGRTHQLRLHFAHLGASILGDSLYGKESELIARHALHASAVALPHPTTKQLLTLRAPLSEDMRTIAVKLFGEEAIKEY